jgi:hypothetical protein
MIQNNNIIESHTAFTVSSRSIMAFISEKLKAYGNERKLMTMARSEIRETRAHNSGKQRYKFKELVPSFHSVTLGTRLSPSCTELPAAIFVVCLVECYGGLCIVTPVGQLVQKTRLFRVLV